MVTLFRMFLAVVISSVFLLVCGGICYMYWILVTTAIQNFGVYGGMFVFFLTLMTPFVYAMLGDNYGNNRD